MIASNVITAEYFSLKKELLKKIDTRYGHKALNNVLAWESLIRQGKNNSDRGKLDKVNHFFNSKIIFSNDIEAWGMQDYWATPIEFLSKGIGDCEDFAIAKYFTLKFLGIPESKLRITYVKSLQYNIHHMVLTYYSDPEAEPLVLDNIVDSITPASKRTDLVPIFSFNGTGLWLAKQRGEGKLAGSSNRIRLWEDLQQKMLQENL